GDPSFDPAMFPTLDPLPDAAREAEEIARLYHDHVLLLGPAAREETVRKELKTADVAHFAVHCVPDPKSAMRSSLVLAKAPGGAGLSGLDGRLETDEVCELNLPRLRLVTLAACESRVERYYHGENMIGAARAFLAARVPVVVASLWPVDSRATAEVMQ